MLQDYFHYNYNRLNLEVCAKNFFLHKITSSEEDEKDHLFAISVDQPFLYKKSGKRRTTHHSEKNKAAHAHRHDREGKQVIGTDRLNPWEIP